MVLVSSYLAHTLFDTSASHSLISVLFVGMFGLEYKPLDSTLSVGMPLGRDSYSTTVIQYVLGSIDDNS